jgi:uncharacterized membrane protein YbhN (UPF0104 family)
MALAAAKSSRSWLRAGAWWLGVGAVPIVGIVVVRGVDTRAISAVTATVVDSPGAVLAVLAVYAVAFVLRAVAWTRTLPGLPLRHALAAIHVSVGANHVLPLRLGEVLRVTSVVRRTSMSPAAAIASTVTMRGADILAVGALAAALGPVLAFDVLGAWGPALLVAALAVVLIGGRYSTRLQGSAHARVRAPAPLALALVITSWMLEGVVMHQAAAWAGVEISPAAAMLVTAVTIAAQIAAVAPGGFGTYEAAATAVLVGLGVAPGTALAIATTAHAVKTVYALATGAAASIWPRPSLLGRLRLPTGVARVRHITGDAHTAWTASSPGRDDAPIVLFMPAHDEEASISGVVRRVPTDIAGHPVQCLVIDDGSTDATARRARNAGAEVISLGRNLGLGAAVRRGLAEGVSRGAVAVAFCDADGEYAPEELATLVAPILAGDADYVVGSRFAGHIGRMRPHRRLGNRVLTAVVIFVARAPVSDGQSGYRALSRQAAAEAQVIHDFNYAQVLTLDMLARGARYAEVPISYRFRQSGRSFVRLGPYLAAVIPAVYRQLNTDVTPLSPPAPVALEHP